MTKNRRRRTERDLKVQENPARKDNRSGVFIPLPRLADLGRCAMSAGATSLGGVLAYGRLPTDPHALWPLVALLALWMAYDIANKWVKRQQRD